ncbi:hypothetical protein R1flu_020478 [Riccia fluitans]|uniref:Uncharacterized protein n=1 Tax=Riccia fluitans TaxID=41844 RepID=A0ABD1ZLM2_9MARC
MDAAHRKGQGKPLKVKTNEDDTAGEITRTIPSRVAAAKKSSSLLVVQNVRMSPRVLESLKLLEETLLSTPLKEKADLPQEHWAPIQL